MDLVTLVSLFPVIKEVIEQAPSFKKWVEARAKREDPTLFSTLLILQTLSRLNERFDDLGKRLDERFDDLKVYSLRNAILSAKLTRPDLKDNEIIEASRFANQVIKVAREI